MTALFQFEMATPDKLVCAKQVPHVVIPGADGDIGVLLGHTPLLTVLRAGPVLIGEGDDREIYVVSGGYAEVLPERATVLADLSIARKDIDVVQMEANRKEYAAALQQLNSEEPAFAVAKNRLEFAEICLEVARTK